ncbi:PEP-CTERM-box response regulator transcription factor [Azospira sp. I13]|uniref:sigma-54-dependent transcriptional regulator n=1 Tax=Azospira sp. I13 TaxID=1765050 RepID=UPI000D4ADC90|nr:sigma-54 dependent transcriptional regulator [Azospira sp. I13]GBG01128.1 PEP-CTERM-box response regulator transcription factor [Azospira sp. I13]
MPDLDDTAAPERPLLLIVDDDPLISDSLAYFLAGTFEVLTSHSRAHCTRLLRQLRQPPRLALVDLGLPPLPHQPDEGFALIGELLALSHEMRIVVLSGQHEEALGRHARTLGATDFIAKPADPAQLRKTLLDSLNFQDPPQAATPLLGHSEAMVKLRTQIGHYADSPFPVLIEGESGSGKEIVAHQLHQETGRKDKPYLALNCAAISPTLLEPTLFGHAKGAFTGAAGARAGYFEEAGEGTLFLDEIGELPLELQPKLLRVLENGEFQRVGETQSRQSRARIVAATNRDLKKEVREGRFRADLYHRLSVFSLSVPPLREMGEDRLLLLEHFRQHFAQQGRQGAFDLDPAARAQWLSYAFPGNVRELRNIVIRLTAKHAGQTVTPQQLAAELDLPALAEPNQSGDDRDALMQSALARLRQDGPGFELDRFLAQWERAYVDAALHLTQGNLSQAARLLGINRTTLHARREKSGRGGEDSDVS